MKKKLLVISAVSITVTAIVSNSGYVNAATVSNTIRSRGGLVLEDGSTMAIYSGDIQYLQDELDMLYGELPYYHNNENGEE